MILLERDALTDAQRSATLSGAIVIEVPQPVIAIEGAGAQDCLQGVLTNDVDNAGDGAFLFGAILTPKGMIECDLWTVRESAERIEVYPDREGLDAITDRFSRSFPPRLAKTTDVTEGRAVVRLAGPEAAQVAARAGFDVPEAGGAVRSRSDIDELLVARTPLGAPFKLQIACARDELGKVTDRLVEGGAVQAEPKALDFLRVLYGWPRLGAEIDQKTLPQEVRFDELEGVSYTKGCYTGQETVARVHFRGHANRRLVGLLWSGEPDKASEAVLLGEKDVGRTTTVAWLDDERRYAGLAILRREVAIGERVRAAGTDASVLDLPLSLESGSLVG